MKPTRIECDIEGLEANWVELTSRWSIGDVKKLENIETDAELLAHIIPKITACNIVTLDEIAITSPAEITEESLADVDIVVYTWLFSAMYTQIDRLRSLGFSSSRLSSTTKGREPKATAA